MDSPESRIMMTLIRESIHERLRVNKEKVSSEKLQPFIFSPDRTFSELHYLN